MENFEINLLPGEEFREITDFMIEGIEPGRYYVSNMGRVYDAKFNRIKSYEEYSDINHYKNTSLRVDNTTIDFQVHRLVMMAFGGPIWYKNLDVNHKDGIKYHNNMDNLEWNTRSQNIQHAYDTGLHPIGSTSVLSKIKDDNIVIQICELLQTGKYYNKDIAAMVGHGVTTHMVDDIKKKQCWTHISKDYNFYQRPGRKFDDSLVEDVCLYFQNNPKPDSITVNDHCRNALDYLNFPYDEKIIDCMRKVYGRKYYTHISSKYNF